MPAKKVEPAGTPTTYEPKTSAPCKTADHGECTGNAFNARTSQWQKCACPCHRAKLKLS